LKKIKNYKIRKIGLYLVIGAFLVLSIWPLNKTFALDSSRVNVNGITIYDSEDPAFTATNGYNSSHGVDGVSFDTVGKTLNLTSSITRNIYANGDLTIKLSGNNAIDTETAGSISIETRGNLTIIGSNGSALYVNATSDDDRAIEIMSGSQLTIGDASSPENLITVSVNRGRNVNTVGSTTVVSGNTYNYTAPGPGGSGDPLPPPGDPVKISIGGVLVIDESAETPILSASGDNWEISRNPFGGWDINVDNRTDSSIGYISGEGDGLLTICPAWPELTVESNLATGYSINFMGEMIIGTCGGFNSELYEPPVDFDPLSDEMNVNLEGGIFTESVVNIEGKNLNIGSILSPSQEGISALELKASPKEGYEKISIYTTGTALKYWNATPGPEESMQVISENGGQIIINQSSIATDNVENVLVQSGGKIDINYTGSLGTFTPKVANWLWSDLTGMNGVEKPPVITNAETGTSVINKYVMVSDPNHFSLESTSNAMANIGFFLISNESNGISPRIPEENQIQHGFIEITAAKGYRSSPGGVYWEDAEAGINYEDYEYSIEVGSEVSIKMLPDYGYQFVSGSINGIPLSSDDAKATYTFNMPADGIDVSANFQRTEDIISLSSDAITSASVELPENEINGNAELVINDATDVDSEGFQTLARSLTVAKYLDLSLNEVIYKGTEEEAWKTPITELDNLMTVNFELSDDLQGYSEYIVLRDHNGTISEVDSTYNPATGVLSFQTDAYSDYAIAHSTIVTNPNTYDGIAKYFVIAFVSLIGFCTSIVVLKRSWCKEFSK